jgi:hypothetical protein
VARRVRPESVTHALEHRRSVSHPVIGQPHGRVRVLRIVVPALHVQPVERGPIKALLRQVCAGLVQREVEQRKDSRMLSQSIGNTCGHFPMADILFLPLNSLSTCNCGIKAS